MILFLVTECPPSSTFMFFSGAYSIILHYQSLQFSSLTPTSSFLGVILLVYRVCMLLFQWLFDISLPCSMQSFAILNSKLSCLFYYGAVYHNLHILFPSFTHSFCLLGVIFIPSSCSVQCVYYPLHYCSKSSPVIWRCKSHH